MDRNRRHAATAFYADVIRMNVARASARLRRWSVAGNQRLTVLSIAYARERFRADRCGFSLPTAYRFAADS